MPWILGQTFDRSWDLEIDRIHDLNLEAKQKQAQLMGSWGEPFISALQVSRWVTRFATNPAV